MLIRINRSLMSMLSKDGGPVASCSRDVYKRQEQRGIRHFLEGIREAGVRAAKIVADMLSFSRRSESHFGPVDLEEMLETVLRLAASDYDLKKKYDFKRIQINRDYDPTLRLAYCDKTEIEQVILNLLKNAAQAMTCLLYTSRCV